MLDWIDEIFKIWNSTFGVQLYGIAIASIILALFSRLRSKKW